VLDVQLAVRDPEIVEIACRVLRCPSPGAPCTEVSPSVGGSFDPAIADLGLAYRSTVTPAEPICRFRNLPAGSLMLEVTGRKPGGGRVTVRRAVRFAGNAP
jgi:hypothetical protein